MTPLEAARRIARNGFTPWEDSCHLTCELCGADGAGEGGPFPHESECPWLQMPKIVAILEALEDDETVYVWRGWSAGPVTRGFLKARELMAGKE